MRWDRGHESPDLIDRRGQAGGGGGGGLSGILALAPLLVRHPIGIVVLLLLLAGSVLLGRFGTSDTDAPPVTRTTGASGAGDEEKHFVAFVLDDAQKTWREIFAERGRRYENAKLVLFDGETPTACGYGLSATGPFYCPSDGRVYIDLSFYDELSRRFGARGDFAQAYVVAHEIGHHVQNQLGVPDALRGLTRSEREGAGGANVRLELQADCYAGVWAHSTETRGLLEAGDVDEAMTAASAVGDDRLQEHASGVVTPETFTHGTAEQRARWFRKGYERGDMAACDTFEAPAL
ncbi:MAG: neutral zinc metallopeptidase [Labilithrix sp.]|nr:neutral zinc metallopeptidase [Labilithrix sp.]